MSEWISVKERLPEIGTDVLLSFKSNMAVGFLQDEDEDSYEIYWYAYTDDGYYTGCDYKPTHWQPLPEPPKEDA